MRTCAITVVLSVTSSLVLGAWTPSPDGASAADGAAPGGPAAPASAARGSGGSIAFVRSGDVWLATPDGAREHRVTTTGGFTAVTQSDDGTLVAVKDSALHRMDQDAAALNAPFRVQAYGAYGVLGETTPVAPDLSPDGSKVAYWVPTTCATPLDPCMRVQVTDSHRASVPEQQYMTQTGWYPTWSANDRLLYSNRGAALHTSGLTPGSWDTWVTDPDPAVPQTTTSALTRAGDRLAFVSGPELGPPWRMRFYAVTGSPPTATLTPVCTRESGTTRPGRLSWAPDGGGLAWEEPDGVRVVAGFSAADCSTASGRTIAGATSPDWGPAEVPADGPPGTGTPEVGDPPAGPVLTAAAVKKGQSVRTVLTKGLRISVRCATRCTVVGRATAKVGAGRRTIGSARRTFTSRGTLTVKPSRPDDGRCSRPGGVPVSRCGWPRPAPGVRAGRSAPSRSGCRGAEGTRLSQPRARRCLEGRSR